MIVLAIRAAVLASAVACVTHSARARATPTVSDFQGDWRINRVIGASEGGVTSGDPKALLNKRVQWGPTVIRSPEGECRLRQPVVALMANRLLETSIWGGQQIAKLGLPNIEIAKAFGGQQTPVFQDASGCAYAVMIDHDHIVDAFGSGWIYRLERIDP